MPRSISRLMASERVGTSSCRRRQSSKARACSSERRSWTKCGLVMGRERFTHFVYDKT